MIYVKCFICKLFESEFDIDSQIHDKKNDMNKKNKEPEKNSYGKN